jgi:hypothetical protein
MPVYSVRESVASEQEGAKIRLPRNVSKHSQRQISHGVEQQFPALALCRDWGPQHVRHGLFPSASASCNISLRHQSKRRTTVGLQLKRAMSPRYPQVRGRRRQLQRRFVPPFSIFLRPLSDERMCFFPYLFRTSPNSIEQCNNFNTGDKAARRDFSAHPQSVVSGMNVM